MNELRFQWSRDFEYEIADQPPPEVYANGSGNFSFGRATFLQRYALPDERRTQFVDNFSYTTGRHNFKFGGEINRVNDFINNPTEFGGVFTYPSTFALGEDLVTPGAKNYSLVHRGLRSGAVFVQPRSTSRSSCRISGGPRIV